MNLTARNFKRLVWWIVFLPANFYRRLILMPQQKRLIRQLLNSINNKTTTQSQEEGIFLASSFRIGSAERKSILKTAFTQSLKNFTDLTPLKIADASEEPFAEEVRQFLKDFDGLKLEYQNKKERLNSAYYNLLTQAKEKYFAMLFDDFPLCNFSPEFLKASESLLSDFKGLVDLVFMEGVTEYKIDESKQTIFYNLNSRDFIQHPKSMIGTVKYGGYEFAILENFHYGFFFNTIIANAKDYAARLKWYMDNIDYNSPHAIELAGSLKIGPVYKFIAVPLNVFNFDIDYSHTDISIREAVKGARELQNALDRGFQLRPAQD